MNKKIYLSSPHMGKLEQDFVADAFATNWIAPLGPHVDAFENELAKHVRSSGALALNSGTSAIHLALKLLGVSNGDSVFCSSLTFVATANPILYQGAKPIFIDSEPESWNMSVASLQNALIEAEFFGKLPKAVIVVNLYGQSADMRPILELCNHYHVPVIEDAAESLGATYQGKASGTFGRFGIYSFNGNKIITTSGGGMLVSEDLESLEKARYWATQARDQAPHYQHSEVGFNYRLSNVLAAIGRGQLIILGERVESRRQVFKRYYDAFGATEGIEFMPEASFGKCTRWLTVMTVNSKKLGVSSNLIIEELAKFNIESRPVWKPLHLQPLFKDCLYYPHEMGNSISDQFFANGLCLPSGSNLMVEEQERIIEVIQKLIKRQVKHHRSIQEGLCNEQY